MTKKILIVGAGPTGMTAAIELNRLGKACVIIDKKDSPSTLSRAVGINQRSLEILEKSEIAQKLINQGFKMQGGVFHDKNDKIAGQIDFSKIKGDKNFILALPQDQTEEIMRDHLAKNGVNIQYKSEVVDIALRNNQAEVTLLQNGEKNTETFDMVIAADGAHSVVRKKMDIDFVGYDYENLWSIADFEAVDFPYEKNHAHVFLRGHGEVGFVIRIGENRYRGVSNTKDTIATLPANIKAQEVHRASNFRISVRQAVTYQKGCVYLAGDAAHVHSPAGGRGMNLGIEDAFILAELTKNNKLEDYTKLRHKIGQNTLKFSERLVFMATAKNPLIVTLRSIFLKIITRFSIIEKNLVKS